MLPCSLAAESPVSTRNSGVLCRPFASSLVMHAEIHDAGRLLVMCKSPD